MVHQALRLPSPCRAGAATSGGVERGAPDATRRPGRAPSAVGADRSFDRRRRRLLMLLFLVALVLPFSFNRRRAAAQRLQQRADRLHHPGLPLLDCMHDAADRRARRLHGAVRALARGGDLPRLRQRPDRLHHQPVAGAVRRLFPRAGCWCATPRTTGDVHAACCWILLVPLPLRPRRVRRSSIR